MYPNALSASLAFELSLVGERSFSIIKSLIIVINSIGIGKILITPSPTNTTAILSVFDLVKILMYYVLFREMLMDYIILTRIELILTIRTVDIC